MDKITKYRQLLKQILSRHIELVNRRPVPGVDAELILDEERDNYMWIKAPNGLLARFQNSKSSAR